MAAPRERRRLSRDDVVATALDIIDAEGVTSCTMRAVASRLGVEAMSLYWHVANKQALLDAVVERVLTGPEAQVDRAAITDWQSALRVNAWGIRRLLHAHPNVVGLILDRAGFAFSKSDQGVQDAMRVLVAAGFATDDAVLIIRVIIRVAFGVCMVEMSTGKPADPADDSPTSQPIPAEFAVEPDALYDSLIESIIAGIEARGGLVVAAPDAG